MILKSRAARASTFLMMILLLGSIFVLIPKDDENVEAVGAPAITIQLAQAKQTAYVAPGQDGIVSFTGTAEAQIPYSPGIQYLVINLQADAGGWPVSVPPALTFSKAQKTQSFTISVQVPIETSQSAMGQLAVSGRWSYSPGIGGGTIPASTAIIFVKQYYQFSIGCEKPYQEVNPGQSLGFKLRLINEGNANDRLRVEILNWDQLSADDWTIQLSQDKFAVMEKTEQTLTVSVTTPVEWHLWYNQVKTIRIKIISAQAEGLGDISDVANYQLYVRQKGFSIPGFEPTFAIIALAMMSVIFVGIAKRKRSH
ncbi:MAG: choice-of-anchor T family protein [Candidatus Thermoplasmatota archaeon]|nr:choice-of-anchor T family protein [Candidatus Thermoplasmatota archaeon]